MSVTNKAFGCGIMSLMLLVPIASFYVLSINREQLYIPQVKRKIDTFYTDIHLFRDRSNIYYYPIFMLRRIIFVALPTFLFDYTFLQIQLLLFLTSIYVMHYAGTKPHSVNRRVLLELYNEIMIMLQNYHMCIFSRFNQNDYSKYLMGNSYIIIFGCTIIVNLTYIFYKNYEIQFTKLMYKRLLKSKKA